MKIPEIAKAIADLEHGLNSLKADLLEVAKNLEHLRGQIGVPTDQETAVRAEKRYASAART